MATEVLNTTTQYYHPLFTTTVHHHYHHPQFSTTDHPPLSTTTVHRSLSTTTVHRPPPSPSPTSPHPVPPPLSPTTTITSLFQQTVEVKKTNILLLADGIYLIHILFYMFADVVCKQDELLVSYL
ncbi:hypothetical protein QVD17_15510 [Tagetes erecta]|uniref:Uncharacterized protein n=1 Tax=Tagetes erecta TaxID=13708 RepID=A0AAD8KPC0_TARER|nr:hypothetical protein QVD17_15510 [Tagetes erecta]